MHTKWPCWKLILVSIVGILDFTHGAWSMYTKIAACFDLALTSDNDWYLEVAQTESSGLRREMCSSGPKMWRQSIKMTQTLLMVLGGKCVPRVQEWHRQCSRSSAANVFLRFKNGSDNDPGHRRETSRGDF